MSACILQLGVQRFVRLCLCHTACFARSLLVQLCLGAFDATLHTSLACKKALNESTEGGLWSEGMYMFWAALDGNQFHMIVGTQYSKLFCFHKVLDHKFVIGYHYVKSQSLFI